MRVCMFVYNPLTNDARVFREAAALVERGHAVDVIGRHNRGLEQTEERDGFTIHRVRPDPVHKRLRRLATAALDRVGFKRVAAGLRRRAMGPPDGGPPQKRRSLLYRELMLRDWHRRALRLAKGLGPADVYHAHDLNTLPLAARAARAADALLVYDSHEIYLERWQVTAAERRIWGPVERRLIGRADRMITVSERFADEFVRRYGIERPLVLLNCPDLPGSLPAGAAERLRQRAELGGSDEPIVLYQGMIQPERGLEDLVEAAKSLDRGVVVMMGWGVSTSRLRQSIDAAGLGDRVRLVDPVPLGELFSYTSGATIGVAPTEWKGMSQAYTVQNKIFEYMGAGLPIVTTRLPGTERIIEDHDVGLLCDPGDPPALAAAINRLLADRELYERLRANAIAASKLFNWQRERTKLLDLYEQLGAEAEAAPVAGPGV